MGHSLTWLTATIVNSRRDLRRERGEQCNALPPRSSAGSKRTGIPISSLSVVRAGGRALHNDSDFPLLSKCGRELKCNSTNVSGSRFACLVDQAAGSGPAERRKTRSRTVGNMLNSATRCALRVAIADARAGREPTSSNAKRSMGWRRPRSTPAARILHAGIRHSRSA